jgi:hypothetical protein
MSTEKIPLEDGIDVKQEVYAAETQTRQGGRLGRFWGDSMTQVAVVGFCCFLCPGMFNALGGIGGGGQLTTQVNSKANTALVSVEDDRQ